MNAAVEPTLNSAVAEVRHECRSFGGRVNAAVAAAAAGLIRGGALCYHKCGQCAAVAATDAGIVYNELFSIQ